MPNEQAEWIKSVDRLPPDEQVVLIWHSGRYALAYLKHSLWYAYDWPLQTATIGVSVRWWQPLPAIPSAD